MANEEKKLSYDEKWKFGKEDFQNAVSNYRGIVDDVNAIDKIELLSPLEKDQYISSLEEAKRKRDPEEYGKALMQMGRQIKQGLSYYMGREKMKSIDYEFEDRGERLQMNIFKGSKLLDKILNGEEDFEL